MQIDINKKMLGLFFELDSLNTQMMLADDKAQQKAIQSEQERVRTQLSGQVIMQISGELKKQALAAA